MQAWTFLPATCPTCGAEPLGTLETVTGRHDFAQIGPGVYEHADEPTQWFLDGQMTETHKGQWILLCVQGHDWPATPNVTTVRRRLSEDFCPDCCGSGTDSTNRVGVCLLCLGRRKILVQSPPGKPPGIKCRFGSCQKAANRARGAIVQAARRARHDEKGAFWDGREHWVYVPVCSNHLQKISHSAKAGGQYPPLRPLPRP